jgi:hypothetical protein
MNRFLSVQNSFFLAIILLGFSCQKEKTDNQSTNSLIGNWNWIRTVHQSDSTIDSASATVHQELRIDGVKNYLWLKNDTTLYTGNYTMQLETSQVYQQPKMMLNLYSFPNRLLVQQKSDTLWLEEDVAFGKIYQFLKKH